MTVKFQADLFVYDDDRMFVELFSGKPKIYISFPEGGDKEDARQKAEKYIKAWGLDVNWTLFENNDQDKSIFDALT